MTGNWKCRNGKGGRNGKGREMGMGNENTETAISFDAKFLRVKLFN